MDIATDCYALAKKLPREELFGLTSQIRRSASSVPANIAEGHGRHTIKESIRYLNIANGSLVELDTHLELAVRVGLFLPADVDGIASKTKVLGAMITAFKTALRRPKQPRQAPGATHVVTSSDSAP